MVPDSTEERTGTDQLHDLVEKLLTKDRAAHETAIEELRRVGDERVVPHLVDVATIDAIATDWETFGFPEVLQDRDPPRYLELPETRWPGVIETLNAIAPPTFTGKAAWLNWETWYSQQDITPLDGFGAWKTRLWWSYLPPVGHYLTIEPRTYDVEVLRWGNTERSLLAPLNAPEFVPAADAKFTTPSGDVVDYPGEDDVVFGFVIDGDAYAVPRWIHFPHELMNAEVGGQAVSLTYCTVCNSPVLYDRTVADRTLTFGSSGLVHRGNKVMFDEETRSLWNQQNGAPMAGRAVEEDWETDILPVTQTDWASWHQAHPETSVVSPDTGHPLDYWYYKDNIGFVRHYWDDDGVVAPGIRVEEGSLPEKTYVYGIEDTTGRLHLFPLDLVEDRGSLTHELGDRDVVAVFDRRGDIAVYEAPQTPITVEGTTLRDAAGTKWEIGHDGLTSGGQTLDRIPGHHGYFYAFRSHYDDITVVD